MDRRKLIVAGVRPLLRPPSRPWRVAELLPPQIIALIVIVVVNLALLKTDGWR
jgi:hypothetical protein